MFRNAVKFEGVYLAPGSRALELYEAKDFKQLRAHLKALDQAEQQRSELNAARKVVS